MARILATFFAFGGSAGLLMCLDVEPGARRTVLAALGTVALVAAAVAGRWGARWRRSYFHGAVGAATALIVSAVALAPNPVTAMAAAFLVTFVVVDAHFFFSARQANAHLGIAVVGITVALIAGDVGIGTALGYDLVLVSIGTVIRQLVTLASSASRDPLTGLSNRRGFDQALEELMAEAARTGEPLSAVLIDVDHFKAVNDTYGHEEGDRVLRRVAEVWQREVPDGTFLARHGGDEFSLLLPGMRATTALALVRRVCAANPEVSLSCGVAQYQAGDSASQLMRSADRALYDAKILGRGRAELVGESARPADAITRTPPRS
ncbi:diguanylate cyclase (GGDEF) domain-containing protein [Blastococcus aurantiacus]|uniref:Diguanylate cyclase (GGDEF) domain-containing protein n=2 Tax=Blastococcus aurantiacus TaxID=1550231 RepID=A0A1G7I1J9_9ACTN|nr:diguanylate cyclase (GGDEF) domain-containing protein [Blastococcus aurantiacus]